MISENVTNPNFFFNTLVSIQGESWKKNEEGPLFGEGCKLKENFLKNEGPSYLPFGSCVKFYDYMTEN